MIRSDKRLQKPTAVRAENWRGGLARAQSTCIGLKHRTVGMLLSRLGGDPQDPALLMSFVSSYSL